MSYQVEFDTTVLGGLLVTARATIYPAEPDVGIFYPYMDGEVELFWGSGKPYRSLPVSMYDKLSARDWDRIEEDARGGEN